MCYGYYEEKQKTAKKMRRQEKKLFPLKALYMRRETEEKEPSRIKEAILVR